MGSSLVYNDSALNRLDHELTTNFCVASSMKVKKNCLKRLSFPLMYEVAANFSELWSNHQMILYKFYVHSAAKNVSLFSW